MKVRNKFAAQLLWHWIYRYKEITDATLAGLSKANHFEARSVTLLLRKDEDIKNVISALKTDKREATVMVISPYRAQVDLIRNLIEEEKLSLTIRVDTVDSFQGQEADVVIVSLVRTQEAGFTD